MSDSDDDSTDDDARYVIVKARGSKKDVWHGYARRTAGGLTKDDLVLNKRGKPVSKKQSEAAKLRYPALKAALCGAPIPPVQAALPVQAAVPVRATPARAAKAPPAAPKPKRTARRTP